MRWTSVLQCRAMVMTDDYVVLADYVRGGQAHVYDNLFQMKGFQGIDAAWHTLLRSDKQWRGKVDPSVKTLSQVI